MPTTIEQNLSTIKTLISAYEKKYHRPPNSVRLVAASKTQPSEKIEFAYHAGQHAFGENYLQEALPKIAALSHLDIEWHFIGPIQSNKTKKIAEHFAWVHSIDDIKIAKRLNDQRPAHLPPLNICIEVNVSDEKTKSGVGMNDVMSLVTACGTLPKLKLRGLMAIPAIHHDFLEQRKEFHKLFTLYESLNTKGFSLDTLSMGMSDDFEAAIAEGATIIRIGTAIFGSRVKP